MTVVTAASYANTAKPKTKSKGKKKKGVDDPKPGEISEGCVVEVCWCCAWVCACTSDYASLIVGARTR